MKKTTSAITSALEQFDHDVHNCVMQESAGVEDSSARAAGAVEGSPGDQKGKQPIQPNSPLKPTPSPLPPVSETTFPQTAGSNIHSPASAASKASARKYRKNEMKQNINKNKKSKTVK